MKSNKLFLSFSTTLLLLLFIGTDIHAQMRDPGFGFNGFVKADIEGYGYDRGLKVFIQSDNKILSVGSASGHPIYGPRAIAIIRYGYNGEPDSTFAEDGIKIVRVNNNDTFYESMLLQSDQKILVAGQYQTSRFLLRLNTDGSLDSSFAEDGILNFDADSNYYDYYSLNLLEGDKILLLRRYQEEYQANYSYELQKYTSDGSLDIEYADMGRKALSLPDSGNFLLSQNFLFDDDQLLLMGRRYTSDEFGYDYTHFAMVKLLSNGDLDSTFGESGAVIHSNMVNSEMELQSDGKIVCVGSVGTNPQGTQGNMGVMRFNINGSVDSSFSDDGFQSINIDSYADYANALEIQEDGKLIIGGSFFNFAGGSGTDCALVRLNSDGSFDESYGDEGVYKTGVSSGTDQVVDMKIQDQNKVVFVGYGNYATFDIVTVRIIMQGLSTSGDVSVCPGDSTTLYAYSDSVIIGWAIDTLPSVLLSNESSISVSPEANSTYLVYSSSDTASITVSIRDLPMVNIGNDSTLCLGEDILLQGAYVGDQFLWQDGSQEPFLWVDSAGIYWVEVSNSCGMAVDSVHINYNLLSVDLGEDQSACEGDSLWLDASFEAADYVWNTGSTESGIWADSSGVYRVILNLDHCSANDSITLSIFENTSAELAVESCLPYTSPDGNESWNETGIYYDTIPNFQGCDSIISIDLTIYSLEPEISIQGAILMVDLDDLNYQWIDCNNANSPIEGANEQSFSPTENGLYAVEVSNGECSFLSDCIEVNSVSINELIKEVGFQIYPNPTRGLITLMLSMNMDGFCEVYDLSGQQIVRKGLTGSATTIDLSSFPTSFYFIKIQSEDGSFRSYEKVLKE